MGNLVYGASARSIEFADRDLAHLQFVIASKLRRSENFLFNCVDDDGGLHVVWLNAAVPLEFVYTSEVPPPLNRQWLEVLTDSANHSGGLRLVPEPAGAMERVLQRT